MLTVHLDVADVASAAVTSLLLQNQYILVRARAQLEEVEEVEELDQVEDEFVEDGLGDEAAGDNFDLERGRRSLASIFDSDEDSVVEVDSAQQDESLLVRPGLLPCTRIARDKII